MALMLGLLRRARDLSRRDRCARAEITAHQTSELQALRRHAYTHSPFYQRFHRGLFDRPLHELPVLSKAQVMEHFDELVTDRALRWQEIKAWMARQANAGDARYLGLYWICATSGGTGRSARSWSA